MEPDTSRSQTDHHRIPMITIATLDRLQIPTALSGATGRFRFSGMGRISASNDLEAILAWLEQYRDRPETYRAYMKEAERLVNWALVERNKPISSLDEADLAAYEDFLADPQPRSRWIHSRGVSRTSRSWTPFIGPLLPSSRLYAFAVVGKMLKWLRSCGYCSVWLSLGRHRRGDTVLAKSALLWSQKRSSQKNVVTFEDWTILWKSARIDQRSSGNTRSLVAIELMYFGGMRIKHLAELRVRDFANCNGIATVHPTDGELIYLAPPLFETVGQYFSERGWGLPRGSKDESSCGEQSDALVFGISRQAIATVIQNTFQQAVDYAHSNHNDKAESRLALLMPSSLVHAFEAHAKQRGHEHAIFALTGAHSLLGSYIMNYLKRKKLDRNELEEVLTTLAWAWAGQDQTSDEIDRTTSRLY